VDATAELRSAAILELENGIYALDRMLRARALSEVARQAELLQASAANLAEMLEDGADPVEMLARLEALERTLQKVMENAAKLDDGGLKEFVNSRGQEAQSLIEEIREAIREGRTDEARELMERLQRAVQEMSEGIEDNLEQMNQQSSELAQMAEDLGAQLEQLEADQRSLQEQVTELREKSDAASAERAEDLWEKAEQLAGEAVKLGDRYAGGVRRAGRSFAEQERSDNGVAETARLKDAIEGRDLDGAYRGLNEARRAWGHADTLRTLEELSKGRELPGPGPDAMLAIEDGLDAVEKVLRELLELSDEVEPETREQVRELREQQRELDERLDSARQSAQEFTREMPVKPDGMEDALERAGEQMSRAEGALGAGQPMPAEGAMGAAAQEIADAREAMDRAMQQMQQMQQQGEGGEGGEQDAQRGREGQPMESLQVEIPRPEDYIVPEEYRRALLEGMEGEVPDEYRSMKKRYYEELVQQ
jgi:chromosome segregation ATPase